MQIKTSLLLVLVFLLFGMSDVLAFAARHYGVRAVPSCPNGPEGCLPFGRGLKTLLITLSPGEVLRLPLGKSKAA
jgi:hypothetical protein